MAPSGSKGAVVVVRLLAAVERPGRAAGAFEATKTSKAALAARLISEAGWLKGWLAGWDLQSVHANAN
jgi:hypothetical protein